MILIVVFEGTEKSIELDAGQEPSWEAINSKIKEVFPSIGSSFSLTFGGISCDTSIPFSSQVPEGATLEAKKKKFFLHDIPAQANAETLLQLCEEHDTLLGQILEVDTELGESLSSKDVKAVRMLMMKRSFKGHKVAWEKKKEEEEIWANPDTAENQQKIAEMLRVQEVERLHNIAMEENPESFAQVYMLYVQLEVNNIPLKAFVDSGAQMTIMSEACAERCNVLRFLDKRYAGMASGVGTAKILGKIHMVQMKLGNSYFPVSATILENSSMDVLFGLDTLKRYRCCIDLQKNVLRMNDGVAGQEEVPFLSEAEIPTNKEKVDQGQGLLGGGGGGDGGAGENSSGGSADKAEEGSSSSSSSTLPPAPPPVTSGDTAANDDSQGQGDALAGLMAMGFQEVQARQALEACGGDANAAAALLFASQN